MEIKTNVNKWDLAGVQPWWIQEIRRGDGVGKERLIRLRNNSIVGKLSGGRGLNNLHYTEDQ